MQAFSPLELCEPKCQGHDPSQLPARLQGQDQAWVSRVGKVKGLCKWPLTAQGPHCPWEPSSIRLADDLEPRHLALPRYPGQHPATSKVILPWVLLGSPRSVAAHRAHRADGVQGIQGIGSRWRKRVIKEISRWMESTDVSGWPVPSLKRTFIVKLMILNPALILPSSSPFPW